MTSLKKTRNTRSKNRYRSRKSVRNDLNGLNNSNVCPSSNICAPSRKMNSKTCSCLSRKSLVRIAEGWNRAHKDKIQYKPKSTYSYLWKQIRGKMSDKCRTEWCWIQQEFIKRLNDKEINNSYRPTMPKKWLQNKHEWLRTDDIENVMNQYEEEHEDFSFIGPVPIDFDKEYSVGHCVVDELCKIDIQKMYKNGFRKLGVVFNLDPHDKPGSHWVAMYSDINQKGIYYFDSYGVEPPNEVVVLMKRIQTQAKGMGINMSIQHNTVRHQYKNSECGVYCLFFITELLDGKKFKQLVNSPMLDEQMNKRRSFFYVNGNDTEIATENNKFAVKTVNDISKLMENSRRYTSNHNEEIL